ncbi:DUF1674-domain-containing protein [Hypoxylon sp. FL1284]|nr:DUF1674-domain-containing protein [Hypoxylon sp. FL1284]
MASRLSRLTSLARHARPLVPSQHHAAAVSVRHASNSPSPFQSMPSPPRLPADEQAEFERLQRTANTQQGFNPTSTPDFASPAAGSSSAAVEEGGELAPTPLRKGAPPEFEGEVNPKTGEVGGPKNEPLRWGAAGDYSFNGRVTDF